MEQNTALIIIDEQNDYFAGGRNPLHEPERAMAITQQVLARFRAMDAPIIHIRHMATPDAPFFIPGTHGCEIHEGVAPIDGEAVVIKREPDSFQGTILQETLRSLGIRHLVVCGMMTHMCVDTTVRRAYSLGFDVTVIADACATKDLSFNGITVPSAQVQTAYLAALDGTFATVTLYADWPAANGSH
jgi:nicotinamidase-related amidase